MKNQTNKDISNSKEISKEITDEIVSQAWRKASSFWNNPSIPFLITAQGEDFENLGKVGEQLEAQLAFMKFPEFQTYANLEKITEVFDEDAERGLTAVLSHEQGHRFCPFSTIDLLLLQHYAQKAIEKTEFKKEAKSLSGQVVNLYTDLIVNTSSVKKESADIVWTYQQLSKDREDSFWKVYARTMEISWNQTLLSSEQKLIPEEETDAKVLAGLFERNLFDRNSWKTGVEQYAPLMAKYVIQRNQDKKSLWDKLKEKLKGKESGSENATVAEKSIDGFDDIVANIPKELDEKTAKELAKRLADFGPNGIPTNPNAIKEFKEIAAGFEKGLPVSADITFYDILSDSYDVVFAKKPFGKERESPFQPVKWQPSMGVERLDVSYSLQTSGGRLLPGVNTYAWNSRKRVKHGLEEVVPDLEVYIDASGSLPNPLEQTSLFTLAGFVVVKKAGRHKVNLRATVFSGEGQSETAESKDPRQIFPTLVKYYGGGTVFPTEKLLEKQGPKQVLIITDTFLANTSATCEAIKALKQQNSQNNVTIYALHHIADATALREAGAEVIYGTNTNIFKEVIGKSDNLYRKNK